MLIFCNIKDHKNVVVFLFQGGRNCVPGNGTGPNGPICSDRNNSSQSVESCRGQACPLRYLGTTAQFPQELLHRGLYPSLACRTVDAMHRHLWTPRFPLTPGDLCDHFRLVMVEEDGCNSCLTALGALRVSLVDQLEGRIDSLLEILVGRELFTRDDREEVLCKLGARARVRTVLDILTCKEYNKVKQKHKDVLTRRSESMLFYNTRHGEKILFSDHYVNLLLADGHQGLEKKRHEVLTFGQKRLSLQQKSAVKQKISPAELFSSAHGNRPVKKVLVSGVAGIGKTILVQKMLFDFGRNKSHLGFDFIFHMTFRDLNLIDKTVNFRELVLRKNRHLAKELDNILANEHKLLIILDGFDEFRHYRSCDVETFVTEPEEVGEVVEVFGSLMHGELLPNASVLLTSRPAAISHIPVGCIDRFVLIAGFSLTEVQDFFFRYFQDRAIAESTFAVVSANELMLTLCYIPAFCYIVCCILRESKDLCEEKPKTMTDIYVQYLVALLRSHTQARAEPFGRDQGAMAAQPLSDVVLKLGRLAFQKLLGHQTLFYGSDGDVAALVGCSLVSTFLDKTVSQEPGCTEEVYSFAHLTVQEFFAAVYYAVTDDPLPEVLQHGADLAEGSNNGHLDLFNRFLSGILSERNANLLSRQVGLCCQKDKVDNYRQRIIRELTTVCESGAHILNHLHCLFEQQDPSLALSVQPKTLQVNVSDETLSQMDYNAIKYFLNLTKGEISELDLTGTGVSCEALRDIQPLLLRSIWNDLTDTDPYFFCPQESITVSFTEDGMWTAWGEWVFKRCEVSSNEKLLMVLRKVCNISVHCLEVQWAKTFYQQLSQLIRQRIECCTEDDMSRKLKKFEQMLNH
uniref:NACHT domain-containing protein n=1 Tax=Gasterosteus aculeatus aculeatus TaxID=481459 RepID=A0AAQ4QSX5_GASAC